MDTSTDTPRDTHHSRASPHRLVTLVAVAVGFIMAMLDVTIVNVALKTMQTSLSMSLTALVWVVDAYTLSFAALLLFGGACANRVGAKRIYLCGLAIFVVASLLCGVSLNAAMLLFARLLQGVGAALFMPSSLSLLTEAFPVGPTRTKMIGIWGALVSAAMALGPLCGGVLIASFGWRSIFLVNLPIGVAGLWLARRCIAESPRVPRRLNAMGHVFGVIGLGALSYALIEGPATGWTAPVIVACIGVALLSACAFIVRERHAQERIFPLSLIAERQFSGGTLVGLLINFAVFAEIFQLSLFLQHVRNASPLQVGLQLSPLMALFAVGNLSSARVSARFGARRALLGGLSVATLASLSLFYLPAMPFAMIACLVGVANLGAGEAIPAMNLAVMQAAGAQHSNIAAATLNASRQIGSLLGVAVMSIILQATVSMVRAASVSFIVIALAFLLSALVVLRTFRPLP
ncbi:MFS transporter [Paraburkholderia sp.]|uniref:MFS transporter n=1 Tax=Paraburkholderia sp. TaxID=1926495 RepID=UPI00238D0DFC|nr:MFS transporter [Paraburkholderia sp.]MDE1181901.1 MFS transporter [Paraburkholderia sp.]